MFQSTPRSVTLLLLLAGVTIAVAAIAAQKPKQDPKAEALARGKYLVHNVGMCVDCHGQDLKGGLIPFKPTVEMPWAAAAPGIRGDMTLKYSEAQFVKLLSTGKVEGFTPPRPPMPPYKMTTQDAKAVVAYLRSLK